MGPADLAVVTFNVVPPVNDTFKYERLGPMAVENHRQYCARQGYTYFDAAPVPSDRPACWAKIPAILSAFESHRWVLWADSDALVFDFSRGLEEFCDGRYDLVTQNPDAYFRRIGADAETALEAMPINTGVFLMQATEWSKDLLQRAYDQEKWVSKAEMWNGIGDQEALIDVLKTSPGGLRRIRYVEGLQSHPSLHRSGDLFVHFYGSHAQHRIPLAQCEAVLRRWEAAVATGGPLPHDLARFHWCCIQNKSSITAMDRGGPERFLYRPEEIEG
jgi:hypothetical protein